MHPCTDTHIHTYATVQSYFKKLSCMSTKTFGNVVSETSENFLLTISLYTRYAHVDTGTHKQVTCMCLLILFTCMMHCVLYGYYDNVAMVAKLP